MFVLTSDTVSDLTDLVKSALICKHLNLDFAIGEDAQGQVIAVDSAGVIGGLQIAFEIAGLQWPVITTQDVGEFAEINGIELQ